MQFHTDRTGTVPHLGGYAEFAEAAEGDITAVNKKRVRTWSDLIENIPLDFVSISVVIDRKGCQVTAMIKNISGLNSCCPSISYT